MKHTVDVEIHKKGIFFDDVVHEKKRIGESEYQKLVKQGRIVDDRMVITDDEMSLLDMFLIDEIMEWD